MKVVLLIVAVIILYNLPEIIDEFEEYLSKKRLARRKKIERWGEFIVEPTSGTYWDLAKYVDDFRTDSRPYLESLGFKFLGIANEMLLWVEPPSGWTKSACEHPLWSEILDQDGKVIFKYFYKNDIMNPSDYKAILYKV